MSQTIPRLVHIYGTANYNVGRFLFHPFTLFLLLMLMKENLFDRNKGQEKLQSFIAMRELMSSED